jgi:hypothetical protein
MLVSARLISPIWLAAYAFAVVMPGWPCRPPALSRSCWRVLAAVATASLRLPFWVDLGLLAPAFAAVIVMPETVRPAGRSLPRMQRYQPARPAANGK